MPITIGGCYQAGPRGNGAGRIRNRRRYVKEQQCRQRDETAAARDRVDHTAAQTGDEEKGIFVGMHVGPRKKALSVRVIPRQNLFLSERFRRIKKRKSFGSSASRAFFTFDKRPVVQVVVADSRDAL
ncbi:hypothetical protein [Paraburkholderia nemoris]|uniref:hypothetical protein n=1 Tax=Paraburkholderia nemoris TaxID=2793076 RepID=UPI001F46B749|nr:hypothetical protein [Paraburkholderia nemoris]